MTEEEFNEALYFVWASLAKDCTPEQMANIIATGRAEVESQ